MSHYRNTAEIPLILVGTQGKGINKTIILSFRNVSVCVFKHVLGSLTMYTVKDKKYYEDDVVIGNYGILLIYSSTYLFLEYNGQL